MDRSVLFYLNDHYRAGRKGKGERLIFQFQAFEAFRVNGIRLIEGIVRIERIGCQDTP